MAVIALNVHDDRRDASTQARELASWLADEGHEVREVPPLFSDAADAFDREKFTDGLDLMVSLGGDGSVLRSVHLVADAGVPVLGVNFGRMAYLTEVEPAEMTTAVQRCLAGEHSIEERMRVFARVERADGTREDYGSALNEAVLENVASGRTIEMSVTIDGDRFTTYAADGLIVATPTGSTAYSLSARGPIVAPTHEAIIVTAVSPHMLFDRSLVLSPDSEVRIEVVLDRPASLAVDGRPSAVLEPGDAVVCSKSRHPARFTVFGPRDFLGVLKSRFGLAER